MCQRWQKKCFYGADIGMRFNILSFSAFCSFLHICIYANERSSWIRHVLLSSFSLSTCFFSSTIKPVIIQLWWMIPYSLGTLHFFSRFASPPPGSRYHRYYRSSAYGFVFWAHLSFSLPTKLFFCVLVLENSWRLQFLGPLPHLLFNAFVKLSCKWSSLVLLFLNGLNFTQSISLFAMKICCEQIKIFFPHGSIFRISKWILLSSIYWSPVYCISFLTPWKVIGPNSKILPFCQFLHRE